MNYTFSNLNPREFEILSADLLSAFLGQNVETFKAGKDEGVDGRFFINNEKECIIQCKHYFKSGYQELKKVLKEKELQKVKKLNPARYIVVTSISLGRKEKKEIKEIFEPYIKKQSDILGQEDLNHLLRKNKEIERSHYKLWISSANVLETLLNNAIIGRSKFELEEIQSKAFKYIQTKNHDEARNILNEKNVLIISGEPGIGKTTLAENLCLEYVSKKFELCVIEESISEAENVFEPNKKQIFYYDDFLGSNFIEIIDGHKESHITKFVERVSKSKNKKIILTSRTNILNQGIIAGSHFQTKNIRKNEFLIEVRSLNNFDKARILYNHIYHSSLSSEYIDEIYKNKRYKDIIKHRNFNPRLIELITDKEKVFKKAGEYWKHIEEVLDNPTEVWAHCFDVQNNEFVRILVFLVVFTEKS